MAEGFFVVHQSESDPRDIVFETKTNAGLPPDDQLTLKAEVERALVVIQMLFEKNDQKVQQAFHPLLSLAQCGLVGPSAQPEVARLALVEFKKELIAREAGNVKNLYLRLLGIRALLFAAPALIAGLVLHLWLGPNRYTCFCALWVGCMAGVWLSFGARKTLMNFEDLNVPEADQLEPSIRLVFAGLLTAILGLLFLKQAVVVTIGAVSTSTIGADTAVALLVGCLAGFSELALPSRIAKQAALLFSEK